MIHSYTGTFVFFQPVINTKLFEYSKLKDKSKTSIEQDLSFLNHCFSNSSPGTCQSNQGPIALQLKKLHYSINIVKKFYVRYHGGINEELTARTGNAMQNKNFKNKQKFTT